MNSQRPLGFSQSTSTIQIHSVWKTIQGEGPFIGRPAVFVRLHGCNLQCPNCDTAYLKDNPDIEVGAAAESIANEAAGLRSSWTELRPLWSCPKPLIVFTGGEPLRQGRALANLMAELIRLTKGSVEMQIETNGTISPKMLVDDERLQCQITKQIVFTLVISPKITVHHWWYGICGPNIEKVYWKYVGAAGGFDRYGLPQSVLGMPRPPAVPCSVALSLGNVMLQPEDHHDEDINLANAKACAEACLKNGYKYTPQLHKMLGLP